MMAKFQKQESNGSPHKNLTKQLPAREKNKYYVNAQCYTAP